MDVLRETDGQDGTTNGQVRGVGISKVHIISDPRRDATRKAQQRYWRAERVVSRVSVVSMPPCMLPGMSEQAVFTYGTVSEISDHSLALPTFAPHCREPLCHRHKRIYKAAERLRCPPQLMYRRPSPLGRPRRS